MIEPPTQLRKYYVGKSVRCEVCGQAKCPLGRSAPIELHMCHDDECQGYRTDPQPSELWPGESEFDFGYPVSR